MLIILTPDEIAIVLRPVTVDSVNAAILREVQQCLNPLTGDLELTAAQLERVFAGVAHWQGGGYRNQLRAVLRARRRRVWNHERAE